MAQQETIINTLELSDDGAGRIVVKSDPAITALIGKPSSKVKSDSDNYDIVKANGFRVLVFLGNDPKKSRSEAFARQNLIKTTFIDMATYIDYDAPNWKVLAGDFVTREDATLFKEKLQKEFPQFGKEIYIINDKINLFIEK
jgi:hypothetical protein